MHELTLRIVQTSHKDDFEAEKESQSFLFGVDRNRCLEIQWREARFQPKFGGGPWRRRSEMAL